MASFWQKTLFYLGLVDEEDHDAGTVPGEGSEAGGEVRPVDAPQSVSSSSVRARPPGSVVGRRIDPPDSQRRRMSSDATHAEAGIYVKEGTDTYESSRVEPETRVIVARNFSDAQTLADSIRMSKAVVLDLRSTEPEMVRRIVDFTSGLTYALDGKMAKIARGVILVTPVGASISVEEQERLTALGLYATSR